MININRCKALDEVGIGTLIHVTKIIDLIQLHVPKLPIASGNAILYTLM